MGPWIAAALLAWGASASERRAPARTWRLEWSAPSGCPDREAVRARVDDLVGDAEGRSPGLVVRGRVKQGRPHWTLDLELDDGDVRSSRRMEATACPTLVDVAALVVAIELDAVQAGVATQGPAPRPAIPDVIEGPPVRPTTRGGLGPADLRPQPRPDTAPRRRGPGLGGGLHVGVGAGALPGVGPVLGGSMTVAWPRLRLTAMADSWSRQTIRYPDDTAGASLGLTAGGLRVCPVLHPGPVEVPLCAGGWVGALRGEGQGVGTPRVVTDAWAAVELEPGIAWAPIPAAALRLGVGGLLAVRRPSYLLRDRPVLFVAPAVGARVTLALELRWRGERFAP